MVESIKLWLAKVGYERMQDMADPSRSLDRAREYWQQHGRSEKWIQQRMTGQETRNKLTDYWKDHEIKKEAEFAILTGNHINWLSSQFQMRANLQRQTIFPAPGKWSSWEVVLSVPLKILCSPATQQYLSISNKR